MRHGDATEHAIPLVSSLGFLLVFEHLVLISMGSESQRFAIPFKADVYVAGLVLGVPQLRELRGRGGLRCGLELVLNKTRIGTSAAHHRGKP